MKTINLKANHSREIQKFIYRFEEKINKVSVKWIVSINQFRIKSLHKSNLAAILFFTGLIILCESCAFTWIGRSVGGDIGRPRFNDYSDTRIIKVSAERINYGGKNHVEVHKTDSSVLTGIFRGFTTVPSEKYNPNYNQFAVDSLSCLANLQLSDELLLASVSNNYRNSIEENLEGYYPYRIRFKKGNSSYALSPDQIINLYNSKGTEKIKKKLDNKVESNKIPLRNGVIILNDKHQKLIFPIQEIAYARCQRGERSGKLIGIAVGILIDAVIVMVKSRDELADIKMTMNF
jgi:hypothetical protein